MIFHHFFFNHDEKKSSSNLVASRRVPWRHYLPWLCLLRFDESFCQCHRTTQRSPMPPTLQRTILSLWSTSLCRTYLQKTNNIVRHYCQQNTKKTSFWHDINVNMDDGESILHNSIHCNLKISNKQTKNSQYFIKKHLLPSRFNRSTPPTKKKATCQVSVQPGRPGIHFLHHSRDLQGTCRGFEVPSAHLPKPWDVRDGFRERVVRRPIYEKKIQTLEATQKWQGRHEWFFLDGKQKLR